MNKIGIVTFHRAENYGAVLQTYALARTMRKLGADCEVVDFRAAAIEDAYKLFKWNGNTLKSRLKNLKKSVRFLSCSLKKKTRFAAFVRKYIPTSDPVTEKELSQYSESRYRVLVTGSDQVFSARHTKEDLKNYLLAFAPASAERYSYAASFGYYFDTVTEDEAEVFRCELAKFCNISVREYNGVAQVAKYTGKTAQMHLDPTLLVRKEEWLELCDVQVDPAPYIFMYMMHNSSAAFDYARELSERMNLPVLCLLGSIKKKEKVTHPRFTYLRDCSPEKFLGLVQGASYIITTSFHGTAFSIIFRKPFMAFISKKNVNDDRIRTLLKLTGLEGRMWIEDVKESENIDWEYAEHQLELERKKARDYLLSIIE